MSSSSWYVHDKIDPYFTNGSNSIGFSCKRMMQKQHLKLRILYKNQYKTFLANS